MPSMRISFLTRISSAPTWSSAASPKASSSFFWSFGYKLNNQGVKRERRKRILSQVAEMPLFGELANVDIVLDDGDFFVAAFRKSFSTSFTYIDYNYDF